MIDIYDPLGDRAGVVGLFRPSQNQSLISTLNTDSTVKNVL